MLGVTVNDAPQQTRAHQASRRKDCDGRLIAEIADYAAVRELVADLVAEGAEVTFKPEVRETVAAAATLLADGREEVRQDDIKNVLHLDKSVVSRRVAAAMDAGLLRNREDRKGRPAQLVLGNPMPAQIELLPQPERLRGCTVAEGGEHASSAEIAVAESSSGAIASTKPRGPSPTQTKPRGPPKPRAETVTLIIRGGTAMNDPHEEEIESAAAEATEFSIALRDLPNNVDALFVGGPDGWVTATGQRGRTTRRRSSLSRGSY